MDQIYYCTGFCVFWFSTIVGILLLAGKLLTLLLNYIGKRSKAVWIVIEYAYYRRKFKNWVKDKNRHPKLKD